MFGSFCLQIFRKILFFEASCLSPHWTSQRTAPLNGLRLSTDWTSRWTEPLTELYLWILFSTLNLQWTGPLTGLPLSMDCTSQWTGPLKGLRLSMDCPSQRTVPLNGLDLSVDCPSHWTVPVKCFLHTEPSTDWTSHWTAPLNGLDLSRTGPLSGLDLSMDCSCSGLPDFLVEFFLKNLGLLDLLSRSKRSLLPMINTSYWLDNCIETEDRITIG